MNKCVVCGREIDKEFSDEFDVCADYCYGIKEGRKQGALEAYKNILSWMEKEEEKTIYKNFYSRDL